MLRTECLSRIRIFISRIQGQKDPGSGSASKNLSIFNPIDSYPGPRIQGPKRHRILIHNTGHKLNADFSRQTKQTQSWTSNFCWPCYLRVSYRTVHRDHLAVHTGEKRHACRYCAARFTQVGTMNKHIKNSCSLNPDRSGI